MDKTLPPIQVVNRQELPREEYGWGQMQWIASRKVNNATELTVGINTLAPGSKNSLHRHPNCEEVLFVVSGEIEHFVEGTSSVRLSAGSCIVVPKNKKHQAHNVGTAPAELFVAFSNADRQIIVEE